MRTKRDVLTALTVLVGVPFVLSPEPTSVAVGLVLFGMAVYAGVESVHRRLSRQF